jgi:hypothetical protein
MENNNTIVWTNSPLSGLCDRLIDFFLIATYCKLNESNFISVWRPLHSNTRDGKSFYQTNENNCDVSKFFKEVRYSDYKHENFLKYFELPKNTLIENHKLNILSFPNLSYFDGYIGGVESPITFYEKYVVNDDRILNPNSPFKKNKSNITKEEFVKTFYSVCNSFQPTKKLIDVSKVDIIPDLTVHLRREDKVRLSKLNNHEIDYRELNDLNELTKIVVDSFLEKKPNSKILFCSDDEKEKLKWENMYKDYCLKTPLFEFDFEQTYYDMYLMSISKNVLLSQRYSGFSMFSSFIKKNNFVYLLEDSQIVYTKWSELENIYYYKDWLKLL